MEIPKLSMDNNEFAFFFLEELLEMIDQGEAACIEEGMPEDLKDKPEAKWFEAGARAGFAAIRTTMKILQGCAAAKLERPVNESN